MLMSARGDVQRVLLCPGILGGGWSEIEMDRRLASNHTSYTQIDSTRAKPFAMQYSNNPQ